MTMDRAIECLFFVGIATIACMMPVQNDTWWHLRAGEVMLDTRHVLLTDVFSHTVFGHPWRNHEWLSEVIFALVHRAAGLPALTALCAAAATGSLLFVYAVTPGAFIHRILILAGVVAGVTLTWSVRPQTLSLLLLGATMWLLHRRMWIALPPLILLWANLHGGVALGGVALAGTLSAWLLATRRWPRALAAAAALSAAATLVTPLGFDYWPEIARSILRSKANVIAEWRAPDWPPSHLAFWVAAAALPLLSIARWKHLKQPEEQALPITALLMLCLALRSMRNISPFLMTAAPAFGVLLFGATVHGVPGGADRRSPVPVLVLVVAMTAAGAHVWRTWRNPPPYMGWHPISPADARAIESCRGPIYNRYFDGGPIIYFAPRQPVMIDSRQDPYPIWLVQADGVVENTGEYRALFGQLRINCAVTQPRSVLANRLRGDGWTTRFVDGTWAVLERPAS
jgi:hypothetical protein